MNIPKAAKLDEMQPKTGELWVCQSPLDFAINLERIENTEGDNDWCWQKTKERIFINAVGQVRHARREKLNYGDTVLILDPAGILRWTPERVLQTDKERCVVFLYVSSKKEDTEIIMGIREKWFLGYFIPFADHERISTALKNYENVMNKHKIKNLTK